MKKDTSIGTTANAEKPSQAPEIKNVAPVGDDIDSAFKDFEKTVSTFTPNGDDNSTEAGEQTTADNAAKEIERGIKVKMFTGFICFLLSGFNVFILNMIKKTKVPMDKMLLSESERVSIEPYMNSNEIIQFIDKMPTWLIGIIHIEYMFIQKHSAVSDEYKVIKKELKMKKV